jgi:hypothetical protein
LSTFVELATAVPEAARPVHDSLYYAVDAYLKVCTKVKTLHLYLCRMFAFTHSLDVDIMDA